MPRVKSVMPVVLVVIVLILSIWILSRLSGSTKATTAAGEQGQPKLVVAETKFTIPPDLLIIPSEMNACAANLNKIYEAIVRYKQAKEILPNSLSDLVPDYIPAPVLICPITWRPTSVFYRCQNGNNSPAIELWHAVNISLSKETRFVCESSSRCGSLAS
jgi:hypothetical protein